MENAKEPKFRNLAMTVIVAETCTLAIIVLLAGLAIAPRSAAALPTYAQRENKPCEYCHINPAGGAERNAKGKEYEENGHKFKK